jgi:hypothetical protein
MSIILFTSLSGSPGVTTCALAAALNWHRPVMLLEADTSKTSSILPGFFRAENDSTLGLSPLSLAHQRGEFSTQALFDQSEMLAPERYFVPGFSNPAAGLGTTSLWGALGTALGSLEGAGTDVIIDLGRLSPRDARVPLLQIADSVLVTTRTLLPDIFAASARKTELQAILAAVGHEDHLGLWLIDGTVETYSMREVQQALEIPVVAKIQNDPRGAAVFSLGATQPQRFEKSGYARSLASGLSNLTQQIQERQDRLGIRPSSTTTEGVNA